MRTTWVLAALAAFAALPAVAQTKVERQVTTTTTRVDCATILNDAERLSCWQSRAYGAPRAPGATERTEERTVSTADGSYRSVERTTTTTEPAAPAVVSKSTSTTTATK